MIFSESYLRDRIYACWVGKNIGGTIGTPFEGQRTIQDVKGFSTEKGSPLPNDDLDLQLAWLRCVDELGPEQVNSKTLGEYWLSYVKPHWNEYGVGKGNMRGGFFPPLSGELFNDQWKNSNGAWIRTEIWAALYPGQVEKAIKYAFEDASVDHGYAEGTYAAIFVAAMESAAYLYNDNIRLLIDIGLSKIPSDCRLAKAVRLVLSEYDKGTDWKQVREMLVEDSKDIGWFQAPANVSYCILGLLYGGCDFKKSLLLAVNCGDDTDCTGATVGALLGIMQGSQGIPKDWQEYIGDEIITGCLLFGHGRFPQSCTELTDCVMNLLPVTLRTSMQTLYRGKNIVISDHNDFSDIKPEDLKGTAFVDSLSRRSQYSFTMENQFVEAAVNFDTAPFITCGGSLNGRISLIPHLLPEARQFSIRWVLPEGWQAEGRKVVYTAPLNSFGLPDHRTDYSDAEASFKITCSVIPEAVNHLILDISAPDRPTHLMIPVTILGE